LLDSRSDAPTAPSSRHPLGPRPPMAAASPGPSLQVARHDRGFLPAGRAAAKDTSLRSARPRLPGGACCGGSPGALCRASARQSNYAAAGAGGADVRAGNRSFTVCFGGSPDSAGSPADSRPQLVKTPRGTARCSRHLWAGVAWCDGVPMGWHSFKRVRMRLVHPRLEILVRDYRRVFSHLQKVPEGATPGGVGGGRRESGSLWAPAGGSSGGS
jgi:hypothetical protein